jgi:heptosyltransferase-2
MKRRILLLAFGDLGDTLLTVPAVRALRQHLPDAHLVLLSKELPASILGQLGLVDETIVVDKHLFDQPSSLLKPRSWLVLARLLVRLRRQRVDTAVLFHHLVTRWGAIKFALLSLASGAPTRVGIDNGRGWFLTEAVADRGFGDRHEAQYFLDVAELLGASGSLELEAPVSLADRGRADQLLERAQEKPLLAVHPGTGLYAPGRRWPARAFGAAAERILDRVGGTCVIVGTDVERAEADEVASVLGDRALNLVGETSVGELGAVLERCSVTIANDGGVAHLSASVGTPVVAVFGPSNDRAWRPLLGTVVAADLACRPCFYRGFERGLPDGCATRECLALVTPCMVASAACDYVERAGAAV